MADQDFKINIRTVADTTGIQLTTQQLKALQTAAAQGNKQAIEALKNLQSAAKGAGDGLGGFAAGAGIGTIVTLLTGAINKWRAFETEQDRIVEKMMEVTRRNYELAQSILATQDAAIAARTRGLMPLGEQYIQLQQELIKLKTEQNALSLPNQSKEWQELEKQISAVNGQIQQVQSQLKESGIKDVTPAIPGLKAGKGESQALVDEMERNRKAAEEQLKEDVWEFDPETGGYKPSGRKQFPQFQPPPAPPLTNPPPNEDMTATPIANDKLERIAAGVETLLTLWR